MIVNENRDDFGQNKILKNIMFFKYILKLTMIAYIIVSRSIFIRIINNVIKKLIHDERFLCFGEERDFISVLYILFIIITNIMIQVR